MRSTVAKLAIGLAITAIGMFGADSQVGTWKLNVAKSKTTNANSLTSRTEVYEVTPDGGVKVSRTDQRKDGTSPKYSQVFKYDGKEYPVTGAQYDTISAKRIDANTTSYEVKKTGGKYRTAGRIAVSKDGKTKTQTVEGTDADGKPITSTLVYDKQ